MLNDFVDPSDAIRSTGSQSVENTPLPTSSGYPLAMAKERETLTITAMHGGPVYRRQLMDMGLRPGTQITIMRAGGRGPVLISAGETRLGIGRAMAEKIDVAPVLNVKARSR